MSLVPRHVPAYANRGRGIGSRGRGSTPVQEPSRIDLFIDPTRLSTRLIPMKNATIFSRIYIYVSSVREREKESKIIHATKLARIIDRCFYQYSSYRGEGGGGIAECLYGFLLF